MYWAFWCVQCWDSQHACLWHFLTFTVHCMQEMYMYTINYSAYHPKSAHLQLLDPPSRGQLSLNHLPLSSPYLCSYCLLGDWIRLFFPIAQATYTDLPTSSSLFGHIMSNADQKVAKGWAVACITLVHSVHHQASAPFLPFCMIASSIHNASKTKGREKPGNN